jgi:hypothetical protein
VNGWQQAARLVTAQTLAIADLSKFQNTSENLLKKQVRANP